MVIALETTDLQVPDKKIQGERMDTDQDTVRGILVQQTEIHWSKAADSMIRLKGSSRRYI